MLMDGGAVTFIIAIIIVAVLVLVAIKLTGKRGARLNVEEYQTRFLKIENKLNRDNPATYQNAIINGDKLLDKALVELRIGGKTMGERLKKCGSRLSNINGVWQAHKLRNAIAHEDDFEVSYEQAVRALKIYKQALKDLGAI